MWVHPLGRDRQAGGRERRRGGRGLDREVTYRWHANLPQAQRYRLVAPWQGLIGVVHYEFKRGAILSRDSHGVELLGALHERGAWLQPLHD